MQAEEQNRVLREWLESHRSLLFKVVSVYAFTPADRDDLFQEVAVQIWRSIPAFRGECAVKSWVYRVAVNSAIAWAKREAKHRNGKQPLDDHLLILSQIETSPHSQLEWLYGRIGELDEIDRSLTLMFLDGFSYREIAATLGISETNVGVKIHRLKSRLTQLLQEEGSNDN